MIDALTACRHSYVYPRGSYHKGARGIDTIDTTFNKKRREKYIEKVFRKPPSLLSIFRWVLGKNKFRRFLEGGYIVFKCVQKFICSRR